MTTSSINWEGIDSSCKWLLCINISSSACIRADIHDIESKKEREESKVAESITR